jgi:O-antigen/teichoic acid export membrane protein
MISSTSSKKAYESMGATGQSVMPAPQVGLSRLAHLGAQTLVAIVLSSAFGIVTRIIVARSLGVVATGLYAAAVIVPPLLYVVGNLGLNVSAIHFIGQRRLPASSVVGNIFSSAIASSALLTLAWVTAMRFLPQYSPAARDWKPLIAIALCIPAVFITSSASAVLQGGMKIGYLNLLGLIPPMLLCLVVIVLSVTHHMTYPALLTAWTSGNVIAAACGVWMTRKVAVWRLGFSAQVLRPLASLGALGYFSNIGGYLGRRVDVLLVQVIAGPRELGYYAVAYGIAELLWYVAQSLGTVLSPVVAGSSEHSANAMTGAVCRHTLAILLLLSAGLAGAGELLIRLGFGASFIPSVAPLRWLLPGIVSGGVDKVLCADLIGRGKLKIGLQSSWLSVGVNIVANLILIPRWGATGAAIASSISYTVGAAFTLVCFLRVTGTGIRNAVCFSSRDASAIIRLTRRSCGILR